MTPDQRDTLLDLHRAAMKEAATFSAKATLANLDGHSFARADDMEAADDAFRAYLFALPVSSHT
jgi:hypothetical protein